MSESSDAVPVKHETVNIPNPQRSVQKGVPVVSATFSGPIPPPDILAGYERVSPGMADRIMRMAEEEAAHRRASETAIVNAGISQGKAEFAEARRGQICALIITLVVEIAAACLIWNGHDGAGAALGIGGVGAIAATFIAGRTRDKQPETGEKNGSTKPKNTRSRNNRNGHK